MTGRAREAVLYSVGTAAVGAVVIVLGSWIAGSGAVAGVIGGTMVAVAVQIAVYWGFFVLALPDRAAIAHGLGVMVRLFVVAGMAFGGARVLGLPPGPTLLSMVACLFGSTLLEAVFLQRRVVARASTGAVTMR